jgi:ribosome-binding protein aMBF1 (putative translation factor)
MMKSSFAFQPERSALAKIVLTGFRDGQGLPPSFSFTERVKRTKSSRDRKIKEAVEKHGYSQKELADHLGLHYSTISRLVRDETAKSKT